MSKSHSLKRTLTLFPVVIFGLAYMAPMTVFTTYGVAAQTSSGMVPAAYMTALIAMLFTAYSYGKMVKAYPLAGSAYTYTQKTINSHAGFLVGWAILMDYLFLPMINVLVAGIYFQAAIPEVPLWVWIVLFITAITIINILGIKVTTKVNSILIAYQFLVIVIFIILSLRGLSNGMGTGTFFSILPFFNQEVSLSLVIAGASILCLSFLGFDAVTILSEETIEPEKTIPKAVFLVALIGGGLFILVSYISHLIYPNFNSFTNADSAAFEIATFIGGNLFSSMFASGMIVLCFASGLSSHASVSRLLYAMGRDSVIPKKIFGYIHPKFRTPINNILLVSLFSLSALVVDLVTAASFINFGALVAFTFVNLSVIAYYFIRNGKRSPKDTILYLIIPLIGAGFNLWLWSNLDGNSKLLGGIWVTCGLIYLLNLTKMFRQRPPELNFDVDQHPSA